MRHTVRAALASLALLLALTFAAGSQTATALEPAVGLAGLAPGIGMMRETLPMSTVEQVAHKSCGSMGTAGRCASGVRSCLRSGKPKAACDAWGAACSRCQTTFIACGQKMGHIKGLLSSCTRCKSSYDRCVAAIAR